MLLLREFLPSCPMGLTRLNLAPWQMIGHLWVTSYASSACPVCRTRSQQIEAPMSVGVPQASWPHPIGSALRRALTIPSHHRLASCTQPGTAQTTNNPELQIWGKAPLLCNPARFGVRQNERPNVCRAKPYSTSTCAHLPVCLLLNAQTSSYPTPLSSTDISRYSELIPQ